MASSSRRFVTSVTPTNGPPGSVYQIGDKVYCRTPFGHRIIEEPAGTTLVVRQSILYQTIRALTKRLLLLMGISFVAGALLSGFSPWW